MIDPAAWSPGASATTLYFVPCSAAKFDGRGLREHGRSLVELLPAPVASEFRAAREAVAIPARVDEGTLMLGWTRYDGHFYRAARATIAEPIYPLDVR